MSVDLEELARRAKDVEPNWDDLREQRVLESIRRAPRAEPEPARPRVVWIAMAALVLLSVAAGLWAAGLLSSAPPVAESEPAAPPEVPTAERSEMVLADGSTVALDADARVRLALQEPARVVLEQERGRAVYTVARMPSRSFEVHTPAAIVRVRGTVFVVEVDTDATHVEVREGRVEVEARTGDARRSLLGAGDALSVAAAEMVAEPTAGGRESEVGARTSESEPAVGARSSESAVGGRSSESAVGSRPSESGAEPEPRPPSADELLERADAARLASDPARAAEALDSFLAHHARDGRAGSAAFTLGRVENRRGRHRAAARAFARSRQLAPAGPLAEDALAQEALAWSSAGDAERARAAAGRYAAEYPRGLHRSRLERLLSGE